MLEKSMIPEPAIMPKSLSDDDEKEEEEFN